MPTSEPLDGGPEPAPTEATRYGIYELRRGKPERLVETDKEGIGPALVQLCEDRHDCGDTEAPVIAVLDQIERRWICGLWHPTRA